VLSSNGNFIAKWHFNWWTRALGDFVTGGGGNLEGVLPERLDNQATRKRDVIRDVGGSRENLSDIMAREKGNLGNHLVRTPLRANEKEANDDG